MNTDAETTESRAESECDDGILVVRRGPGANCSSIGSAVEILFLSATLGAAVLAAVSAVLRVEEDKHETSRDETSEPQESDA